MKEKTVKTVDEETVTVIPSKLKVWQKVDMLSNPWKSSLVLESDTCRTEIPLNPDGSVKWFDDSKLVRHKEPGKRNTTFAKRILKALCGKDESEAELTYSIICYLHGKEVCKENAEQCLQEELDELDKYDLLLLGVMLSSLCERIEELEA